MPISIVLIVVLICGYVALAFNNLIKQRNLSKEGWSAIDVQLKRRHDLIPNLVEVVKAYTAHERETLTDVVKLRERSMAAVGVADKGDIEQSISGDLKWILAVVESYPDLKADKNFRSLQANLSSIEDDLQYARRYYNGTVRDLNNVVESFPSNIIAFVFGFLKGEFFEIEYATERQNPDIAF